jgi:outer membrane protein OmpA-like peptidoglycan-associated protein
MRVFITGLIVFVIWSFFSMWLYVDILKPLTIKQPVVQPIPESQTREADSLKQFYASMPANLMIYFEFDKARFKADPQTDSSIAEFKKWLGKYPDYKLHVIGHTDFIGETQYNLDLGSERALIISKYLETQGIGADKIVTSSRGEETPVADLITSEGRAKNRRTEITLKKQ